MHGDRGDDLLAAFLFLAGCPVPGRRSGDWLHSHILSWWVRGDRGVDLIVAFLAVAGPFMTNALLDFAKFNRGGDLIARCSAVAGGSVPDSRSVLAW